MVHRPPPPPRPGAPCLNAAVTISFPRPRASHGPRTTTGGPGSAQGAFAAPAFFHPRDTGSFEGLLHSVSLRDFESSTSSTKVTLESSKRSRAHLKPGGGLAGDLGPPGPGGPGGKAPGGGARPPRPGRSSPCPCRRGLTSRPRRPRASCRGVCDSRPHPRRSTASPLATQTQCGGDVVPPALHRFPGDASTPSPLPP